MLNFFLALDTLNANPSTNIQLAIPDAITKPYSFDSRSGIVVITATMSSHRLSTKQKNYETYKSEKHQLDKKKHD